MESKRIEYIDVCKFLAMILVIFSHGFKEGIAVAFIFSFHLPLFFFLNGMTLKLENATFGEFISKKLKRYILPMFGLGILCVLFETLIKYLLNLPITDNIIIAGFARIINQTRAFTIWFLPALFFADLIMFGLNKACRGRLIPMGICVLLVLGIGILFNTKCNVPLVWNSDASLFGIIFTYFGFAFRHKNLSKAYSLLTGKRWIALLIGAVLLVATYLASSYIYASHHMHLEMFARRYMPYHFTLPTALIGCVGFTLVCRAISNPILAKFAEANLSLLAFHQVLCFPLFMHIVAKDWWYSVAYLPCTDMKFIAFSLTMTLFSTATLIAMHYLIKFSPVSLIVNQPLHQIYRRRKN